MYYIYSLNVKSRQESGKPFMRILQQILMGNSFSETALTYK